MRALRWAAGLAGLGFCVTLAVIIGWRQPEQVLLILAGTLAGVAASLVATLVVLAWAAGRFQRPPPAAPPPARPKPERRPAPPVTIIGGRPEDDA